MLSESTLHSASQQVSELLGLHFPKNRWSDLERGILSAAKQLEMNTSADALRIWIENKSFNKLELEVLTNHLTVGETYFFRDNSILDVFQKSIIPEILTERFEKNQQIKIWSAGCCSGEEPYTLAILLLETIPDIHKWNISILATDINKTFLQKAMDGIYSNWSFRETPENIRNKYFSKVKDGWLISPEIKKMVSFKYLNLCEDSYPAAQTHTNSLDIIFCRNVLMYFSQELIITIGERFYKALNQGGWFITSPVELSDENFSLFNKIQYNKSIVYHKSEKKAAPIHKWKSVTHIEKHFEKVSHPKKLTDSTIKKQFAPITKEKIDTLNQFPLEIANQYFDQKKYQKCIDHCQSELTKSNNPLPLLYLLVKSYANLGQYAEAVKWGSQLIGLDNMNANACYLIASIHVENNNLAEAESLLKRGLYIDQTHILSHLLLGNVYLSHGNFDGTLRHFNNVSKLLADFDENMILDGTEGHTVGSIRSMTESIKGRMK